MTFIISMKDYTKNRMTIWRYFRTPFFLIVGSMNTIFIRPEDVGTLKNKVGILLIAMGVLDTFFILFHLVKRKRSKDIEWTIDLKNIWLPIYLISVGFLSIGLLCFKDSTFTIGAVYNLIATILMKYDYK